MPNYTKLFNSIVTSTIWTEDDKTRIVWITMLALADQNGEVHSSIPGLARLSAVPIADVERALEKFVSPDAYSRTPDNEGRRIAKIDGGWELLNHAKYRRMASKEDSKAASAERVRRHRARNADVTECNGDVTPCNAPVTVGRDIAEAEAKADTKKSNSRRSPESFVPPSIEQVNEYGHSLNPPFADAAKFVNFYESKGWKVGKNPMKNWKAAVRTWQSNTDTKTTSTGTRPLF